MSIESTLTRLAENTGRIAEALEAMLEERGYVKAAPELQQSLELDKQQFDKSVADQEALELQEMQHAAEAARPAPAPKKVAKKKVAKKKKKKTTDTMVGTPDDGVKDETVWTLPGVRAELHKLQEFESQAAVKSLLKKFGASTLGQLNENKYGDLVAAVRAELDE